MCSAVPGISCYLAGMLERRGGLALEWRCDLVDSGLDVRLLETSVEKAAHISQALVHLTCIH